MNELVVVVCIIALIVGVLLPMWRSAGRPAHFAVENSNLRQVGLSLLMYAYDHEGVLPAHPRLAETYLDAGEDVWFSPYPYVERILNHGDDEGPVIHYGCYLFVNLEVDLDDVEDPQAMVMACAARVSPKQKRRSVLFADGHAELWTDEQLRSGLPEVLVEDAMDGP